MAAFTPGELIGADDLYDIQPGIGRPFTYTALMSLPTGAHRKRLNAHRLGWERGAQVWPQVSSRPLKFTLPMTNPFTLNSNRAFAELMTAGVSARRHAYGDPTFRARALAAWNGGTPTPRWDIFEISEYTAEPALLRRRLTEVAAERCLRLSGA